jgi:scyllo-inositol 2-dehydrogenase (NADP+)
MADLRAAIIGFGLAGSKFHGPLIASTDGFAVSSVVTGDAERQENVRSEHPGARILSSSEDLWQRAAEHDLVVIAAANEAHVPLARRALDCGLPVVVDKPLAASSADARALVQHAEQSGLMLTVFHNRRWDSDQLTLRRLISDGELGEVLRYESRFERWRPQLTEQTWEMATPERGGGVLLDLGSHLVDQALVLFGPVTEVYGEVHNRRGGPADDDAFLALRHASGVDSHLWASAFCAAPGPRLRVLGTRAAYVATELDGQEDALRSGLRPGGDTPWGVEPRSRWGRLMRGETGEPVPSERGAWPEFYAELERSLRGGVPPPVDPWDSVATLEVMDAARQSASTGGPVSITERPKP